MSKVRLREASQTQDDGARPGETISLKPLRVAGVVIRKADLIEALRVYVPALADVQTTEDGEHFWLLMGEEVQGEDSATK